MRRLGGNEKLTSKERVRMVFGFQEPDRVPIDYAANPDIDRRLKEHFGLGPADHEGLMQALGVDFRGVNAPYTGPRLHPESDEPGVAVDPVWGIHTKWVDHGSGGYMDYVDFPMRDADADTIGNWPMPSPDDYDYETAAAYARLHPDKALYVGNPGLGDVINSVGMVRSMEMILMDLLTEEPAVKQYIDRKVAVQVEVTRRTIEACKGQVDFVWIGEDLGTQNSPIISMDVFRAQIRPRHQQTIDMAKSFDLPVMIHTCGSSSWAYEDFIEMGINGVDTLQPEAKNMSPAYLKERFGGRLVFHGCISTAGPVTFGTVDEVIEEVRSTLGIMMPGGGYCMAPTHCLQDNSPTENVVAMYEAAHEFGKY